MAKGPLNIERRHYGMSYSLPLKLGESVTSFKRQLRRLLVDVSFSYLIIFRVVRDWSKSIGGGGVDKNHMTHPHP